MKAREEREYLTKLIDGLEAEYGEVFGLEAYPGERFRLSRTASYWSDYTASFLLYTERDCGERGWLDFAKETVPVFRTCVVRIKGDK
jgi:hypothetical protein